MNLHINDENETDQSIIDFWKNNINELYKQVQEFYSYGFGASEIIFDEKTGLPKELYQIPAETVTIKQETNGDGTYSYYTIQEIVGKPAIKMKLSRFKYDAEYDLPTCFWLGGGKTSEFYEIPYWVPAVNSISAKVALDVLNAKKINHSHIPICFHTHHPNLPTGSGLHNGNSRDPLPSLSNRSLDMSAKSSLLKMRKLCFSTSSYV